MQVPIPAARGLIFDRAGRPLAINVPSWTVKARKADLPGERTGIVLGEVARVTGVDPRELRRRLDAFTGSPYDLVPLARGTATPGRWRPTSSTRSSRRLLPDDSIGRAGVGAGDFEQELRGTYGSELVERTGGGRPVDVLERAATGGRDESHAHGGFRRSARRDAHPAVGAGRGRAQPGGDDRDEPADRRDPGDVPAASSTTEGRLRHLRQPIQAYLNDPGRSAAQSRDLGHLPARVDVQARDGARRARGEGDDHPDDGRPMGVTRSPSCQGPVPVRLEPCRFRAARHDPRPSRSAPTRSSTRWRSSRASTSSVTSPRARLRRDDGRPAAGRGRRHRGQHRMGASQGTGQRVHR